MYLEKPPSFHLDKNLQIDYCNKDQNEFSKDPSQANWCFQRHDKVQAVDATKGCCKITDLQQTGEG